MEFRYDGARQRYLTRRLDPDTLAALGSGDDQWTTYLGDEPVDDYHYDSAQYTWPVDRQYLFGVAEWHADADTTGYLHGDLIGSTVAITSDDATPAVVRRVVYTAFGEAISVAGPDGNPAAAPFATRYGYAGAFGYQEHDVGSCGLIGTNSLPPAEGCTQTTWSPDGLPDSLLNASPLAGFRFQHLGHRYYDPATGRFIQRDPLGIRGGLNLYSYVNSRSTGAADPSGLMPWGGLEMGAVLGGELQRGKTLDDAVGATGRWAVETGAIETGAALFLPLIPFSPGIVWVGYGEGTWGVSVVGGEGGWIVGYPMTGIATAPGSWLYPLLPFPVLFAQRILSSGPETINCFWTMVRNLGRGWGGP